MFYAAQAALLQLGLSADKHSGVVSLFAKEFCKTDILPRDLATILRKAMDARHEGDYDWQANITTNEADIHLANADAFIASVEQYLLK